MPALEYRELTGKAQGDSSQEIRRRVNQARKIQKDRYQGNGFFCNAYLEARQLKKHCVLDDESSKLIEMAINNLVLGARAYDRILKVARMIADLEGEEGSRSNHVAEAIQYRGLDREYWR